MLINERGKCHGAGQAQQFAGHASYFFAEFGWAARGVSMPKRHFAGLAGRGRNEDAIMRNVLDAPGGGAEDDGVARFAFEHLFFVKSPAPPPFGGTGQEYPVQATIWDGAAVDDGDLSRALARG